MHRGASVSELYHGCYVYTACLQCIYAQCTIGDLCIGSLDRVPSPISLRFVYLSRHCSAISAAHQHWMYDVRYIYIYIYIYIYQRNSAIQLTSVGLAYARPNYIVDLTSSCECSHTHTHILCLQMRDIQLTEKVEKDRNCFQIRQVSTGLFYTLQVSFMKKQLDMQLNLIVNPLSVLC